jgi:hypothetical protein
MVASVTEATHGGTHRRTQGRTAHRHQDPDTREVALSRQGPKGWHVTYPIGEVEKFLAALKSAARRASSAREAAMKQLPGFQYEARRRRAVLDGYVRGTNGKIRRQKTLENVTRAKALAEWKVFRADLESGRAVEGPFTLRQFVDRFYGLISAGHQKSTRHTQRNIIDSHLLRYFGDSLLETITPSSGRHRRRCKRTFGSVSHECSCSYVWHHGSGLSTTSSAARRSFRSRWSSASFAFFSSGPRFARRTSLSKAGSKIVSKKPLNCR